MNINLMKCYKQVFNKEVLVNNIENYIMSIIIIITIILCIILKEKKYNKLKMNIDEIVKNKIENNQEIHEKDENRIKNYPPIKKSKINIVKTEDEINAKLELKYSKIYIINKNDYFKAKN